MNHPIRLKTMAPPLLITLTLLCFGLLPQAQAVVPPPDGGYPGFNTAEGQNALFSLSTGSANTAVGWFSLFSNAVGSFNTATGAGSLLSNSGDNNTAFGAAALLFNTSGANNTAVGTTALLNNTTGIVNTAIGANALLDNNGNRNTALGYFAGSNLTTGDNNICIGNGGVPGDSGTIRVGVSGFQTRTFIGAIRGVTTANADAIPVLIDSAGQLGTMSSSRRFKNEIKPMNKTSEAVLGLKPVTFHYKSDKTGTPQFGLIAEEVAKVNPDLVVRDSEGEIYTVRYDAVNAMLLNEFLKEHRKNEQQGRDMQEQKATIALQQKQIEALTAGLQKVNAQLEAIKPAPQVVNNP